MGKRVNKTTRFVVDISKALEEVGMPQGLMIELVLKVKHPKNLEVVKGHFQKQVTIDLTKANTDESTVSN